MPATESIARRRTNVEIQRITRDKECQKSGMRVEILNDDLSTLRAFIPGPPESPYEGAKFELSMTIPTDYPFKPPHVKFVTRVWHPNISSATGTICLDVLKEKCIQVLLTSPEPNDPQDAIVASQYINKLELFNKTAVFWAQHFAGAANGEKDKKFLDKVKELKKTSNVDENGAVHALSCNDWNVERALNSLN
ncbi:E2 ubiquitin-conjugating enzyme [Aphelenchoides besseyi]|nr:E2 ubiquitin-conjugating enzyme [Aphelenchoides besseyi]KAI6210775.1 E2 ubiquitin-conjugating enzyme [Aphelenchoides besseyi]